MKNSAQDFFKHKIEVKKLLFFIFVFILLLGAYFYYMSFYVIVRFNELGPLSKNMSAYYNGFRIGKITSIKPDKDFKKTLVKVTLTQHDFDLPQNTTVHVERFPSGELYLQFLYPTSPAFKNIKRGDILEGIAPYSLEQFMLGQSISGMSDIVSLHIIKALNAADAANQEMTVFFKVVSRLIKDNGKGINEAVNNTAAMTFSLAEMAENLNQVSKKLNDAVETQVLKDTTGNIKSSTENITKATKDIDKTVKKIDDTIDQVNEAAANLNSITGGLNTTLSKKLGGLRVMFGTPIDKKTTTRNACK